MRVADCKTQHDRHGDRGKPTPPNLVTPALDHAERLVRDVKHGLSRPLVVRRTPTGRLSLRYRFRVLSDAVIEEAGRTLAGEATAPAQVFLFGSHARGEATADSDLDFLVVERGAEPTVEEWVRLRDALPPLGVPVDVIVMSDDLVRRRRDVPGSLVYTALREGRLVAES